MSDLATVQDLAERRAVDFDPTDLQAIRAIQDASALFQAETGRTFGRVDTTVLLDGTGSSSLVLPEPPIAEVLTVTTLDTEGVETEVDPSDYRVDPQAGILRRIDGDVWPRGWQNIEVELTSGYRLPGEDPDPDLPDLPGAIRAAVAAKAAELYGQNVLLSSGVGALTSVTMGVYSATYADQGDISTSTMNAEDQSDWNRTVARYRTVSVR